MAPVVRNKDQQVTVGNTYLLDTGLSNAVTIEKCTFLESGRSIVDVRSPPMHVLSLSTGTKSRNGSIDLLKDELIQ